MTETGGASPIDLVQRFYEAFNDEDLDAFVDTLHPHVELQTARGLQIGIAEARAWATRSPAGDLWQRYVVEDLADHGSSHVVALVRKQWWWKEAKELAEDEPAAALFTFKDGLIARWQPFTDRAEALHATGLDAPDL